MTHFVLSGADLAIFKFVVNQTSPRDLSLEKITSRTTGERGCKFVTGFELILNNLYLTIFIIYLNLSILGYLGLSHAISSYLRISWAILGYLELSWALSGYNELSWLLFFTLASSRGARAPKNGGLSHI